MIEPGSVGRVAIKLAAECVLGDDVTSWRQEKQQKKRCSIFDNF